MRPLMIAALSLSTLVACDHWIQVDDGGCPSYNDNKDGPKCSSPPDMTSLGPNCIAASGLTGDRLVCVDFTTAQILNDLKPSWNFDKFDQGCWTVKNAKLQINSPNFPSYSGTCGFLMPMLSSDEYKNYSSFTLSVVHTVDISDANGQKIQIMMGVDAPLSRLVDQTTGKQPPTQWVHTLAKAVVPNGGTTVYQPLFKLDASLSAGGAAQGWQIASIAVLGNP